MIEIDSLIGLRMINDGSVSLLSTRREGRTNVAAISWQMPVSQEPPMLGISLTPTSLSHHFLRETGEFVLSIPDASLAAEVHYCGTREGRLVDKVREMELQTIRARQVSPLLLTNCIGHLECIVQNIQPLGDRIFYLAQVVTALVEEEYFENGWNDATQTLHHLGEDRYRTGGGVLRANELPLPQPHQLRGGLFVDNPRDDLFI